MGVILCWEYQSKNDSHNVLLSIFQIWTNVESFHQKEISSLHFTGSHWEVDSGIAKSISTLFSRAL